MLSCSSRELWAFLVVVPLLVSVALWCLFFWPSSAELRHVKRVFRPSSLAILSCLQREFQAHLSRRRMSPASSHVAHRGNVEHASPLLTTRSRSLTLQASLAVVTQLCMEALRRLGRVRSPLAPRPPTHSRRQFQVRHYATLVSLGSLSSVLGCMSTPPVGCPSADASAQLATQTADEALELVMVAWDLQQRMSLGML